MIAPGSLLLESRLRASPQYELVCYERLSSQEQAAFLELKNDPDFYGILIPRGNKSSLSIKAVSRDVASLISSLRSPSHLPNLVISALGAGLAEREVTRLILDGILEVEMDGVFLTGAEYSERVSPTLISSPKSKIPQMSLSAIEYASALEISDSRFLSGRLYFYNRIPVSAELRKRFPNREAVACYLGLGSDNRVQSLLDAEWITEQENLSPNEWVKYRNRGAVRYSRPTYKLYVSPRIEDFPWVFYVALDTFSSLGVTDFKISADVYSICRPDKFVAYFHDYEFLIKTASQLQSALAGSQSHGVPFTATIDEIGLLSWGIDPPNRTTPAWQERESWRLWVTNRLAIALLEYHTHENLTLRASTFALQRMLAEGIDPETWAPIEGMFP